MGILGPRDIRKERKNIEDRKDLSEKETKIEKKTRDIEKIIEDILNERHLSFDDREKLRFYYKEKIGDIISSGKRFSTQEKLFIDYGIVDERFLNRDKELKRFLLSQEAEKVDRIYNLADFFSRLRTSHANGTNALLITSKIKEKLDKLFYLMNYISKRDFVYYLPITTTFLKPVSKKEVFEIFNRIEKKDISLYDKILLRKDSIPDVVLIPGSGNGIYMADENIFLIPIYPVRSLMDSVIMAIVSYRWEMDIWGDMRDSYASLGSYKHYNSKQLFFQFLKDYTNFITREKKGFRVLSDEVHKWFRIHIDKADLREEKRKEEMKSRKARIGKKIGEETEKGKVSEEIYIPEKKVIDLSLEELIEIFGQRKLSIEERMCLSRLYWKTVMKLLSSIATGEKKNLELRDKLLLDIGLLSTKFVDDNISYIKEVSQTLDSPFDAKGFIFYTFSKYMLSFLKKLEDNDVSHPISAIEDEITRLRQLMKICGKRNNFWYSPVLSIRKKPISPKVVAEILEEVKLYDEELDKVYEVKAKGFPPVVFVPGMGNGFYDWGGHLLMIPIIPLKDDVDSVLESIALLRWDGDRYGEFRFDYSSLKVYKKYRTVDLQRQFITDYKLWLTRELQGYRAFPSEVRAFFKRRIPSPMMDENR